MCFPSTSHIKLSKCQLRATGMQGVAGWVCNGKGVGDSVLAPMKCSSVKGESCFRTLL